MKFQIAKRHAAFLAAAVVLCAATAGATTFSFGEIASSDTISAIRLAADTGTGTTLSFTTVDDRLVIEASVAQIDFANKPAITEIPAGAVTLTGTVFLTGAPFFLPFGFPFPGQTFASFDNGLVDWSIWDWAGGGTSVLQAGFTSTLDFSANEAFLLKGELTGGYSIIGGDPDAQAAFGAGGTLDALLNFGVNNVCGTLAACPFPTDYLDWSANPTMTLLPNTVPEPGTLMLLCAALGAVRRR